MIKLAVIGAGGYVALCVVMFLFQRSLLYFPPQGQGLAPEGEWMLNDGEVTVKVPVREHEGSRAIIYFGGNGEDVSWALREFAHIFPKHALYFMHYRGYCGSTGSPSEVAIQADAKRLFELVSTKHSQVTLVGRSLGTGVAIRLAAEQQVERLILITPYDSIVNIASSRFPLLPVRLLLLDRYDSARYAPLVTAPTRIIAAENDEVIPLRNTQSLFDLFQPGVATMQVIPGAGHNSISSVSGFYAQLTD